MPENKLIAVLENPNYMLNIGNVIRNVNAFGVDKLIVVDGLQRLENDIELIRKRKKLLKYSSGAVWWTDIATFGTTESCIDYLANEGFISVATSPHRKGKVNLKIDEYDFNDSKLAIWFGDEGNGLSDRVFEICKYCISITMYGKVESLNLATTTGIVLNQAVTKRKKEPKMKSFCKPDHYPFNQQNAIQK
ncbi:TrmH family RNA methyltransferase [bacterium]|nr:TrmH family RNA methyltransferase [bacterium]